MTITPHDLFFWLGLFFLFGIFFASIINLLGAFLLSLLLCVIFLFLRQNFFAVICLTAIFGIIYYFVFDQSQSQKNPPIAFDEKVTIEAIVNTAKGKFSNQELILDNKIKIITNRYPEFYYGDKLIISGAMKKSQSPFINGVMSYPQIELTTSNRGNVLKAILIKFRLAFENNLKKVLTHDKATFLTGLTMGNISEISPQLDEAMKASGTTHLVALSGQNITIIVYLIFGLFGFFISSRYVFWPTVILIILFVIMTGAEASLVRAAIMGFIILLAEKSQRIFSLRNALTATALIMVLYNPKVLVFDLGFQLSFMAMIGIGYLQPFFEKMTGWQNKVMKKMVWPSISAQVTVLPLLLFKFGYFNPLSIIANILIAPIVPHTMILGFIIGAVGFLSYWLAFLLAFPDNILLTYAIFIINLFAFNW